MPGVEPGFGTDAREPNLSAFRDASVGAVARPLVGSMEGCFMWPARPSLTTHMKVVCRSADI